MIYNELETKQIVTKARVDLDAADIAALREMHETCGRQETGGFLPFAMYELLSALLGEEDDPSHSLQRALGEVRRAFPS